MFIVIIMIQIIRYFLKKKSDLGINSILIQLTIFSTTYSLLRIEFHEKNKTHP